MILKFIQCKNNILWMAVLGLPVLSLGCGNGKVENVRFPVAYRCEIFSVHFFEILGSRNTFLAALSLNSCI